MKYSCLDGTCVYVGVVGGTLFFRKLTQDLDPCLHPVGQSKPSQSLISTEKQLVEKSAIQRLVKVKAVVIRYDLWMSRKTEEIFSLTAHYCIGPDRNNTPVGVPSTSATDSVSLSLSIMEAVQNFGLEAKIMGITSDVGGNLWVCR